MDPHYKEYGVAFLSEFIGTAILVGLGCLGCVHADYYPNSLLQLTLNFGMVIMMAVQIFGLITGPQMNPALTLAAVILKRLSIKMSIIYLLGQFAGGICGYGLLVAMVPTDAIEPPGAAHNLCVTVPIKQITVTQAIIIEFFITTVLIWVCCGIWDDRNAGNTDSIPLRFGFTIFSLACSAGPFTGASMNPARSFGPALWNNDFERHWIYWIAPLAAGAFASIFYKKLFYEQTDNQV